MALELSGLAEGRKERDIIPFGIEDLQSEHRQHGRAERDNSKSYI
jgi:hypothetical protein